MQAIRQPARRRGWARWKALGGMALMALLLSAPQAAATGAARAMASWYASVAPALFPFLTLMPLLTCREAAGVYQRWLGRAMGAAFNLPGAAAPAMVVGMVAGAPAGTLAARSIATDSGMTRGQLTRVAVAACGFSPAFLIGGIGVGMLNSAALGWRLLEAQLMTQTTLALLTRRLWANRLQPVPALASAAADQPVRAAVLGVLTIGGYMALFGALAGALERCVGSGGANLLLCLLDVPSGARQIAALPLDKAVKLPILAAMCGSGGACVIAQNLGALKGCGVRPGEYVGMRVAAAAISAGYMSLLARMDGGGLGCLASALRANPFALTGLAASLLLVPVLFKLGKSVS